MLLYYSHSRLLQEARGNHFSPLSPEPNDDPCEATAYDIAASNLPLPASSCHHPPLLAPLSSCCCPPPQKGEFNSQCGGQCGSDVLLKCCGSISDELTQPSTATTAPAADRRAFTSRNSRLSVYANIFFFQHPVPTPPPSSPPPLTAAVTAVEGGACDYDAAACCQLPSGKAICLSPITSSHIVLQFVLQMARDRPAHLIQVRGGVEDMRRKCGIRSFLCG